MTPDLAGFWRRAAAALIDGLIVSAAGFAVGLFINSPLLIWLVSIAYYVYFIGSRGQTPGKMALKIRVVRIDNQPLTYMAAFLREAVGKFLSGIAFALGYLWMIWDKDKQTWHDHLAKTQVIKV